MPRPTFRRILSAGGETEVIPNTFKEAITLPDNVHLKLVSDKEIAKLEKNNVYALVPATIVQTGHKIIGSRWCTR